MLDLLAPLAAARLPFTTTDAAKLGVDRHVLAGLARAGTLARVDRGAYVPSAFWRDATAEQRHLLRCRAVLRRYGAVALSHTSAVVAHGLPVHAVDLDEVHLTRTAPGRTGRVARQLVVQVHRRCPPKRSRGPTGCQRAPHRWPCSRSPTGTGSRPEWSPPRAGCTPERSPRMRCGMPAPWSVLVAVAHTPTWSHAWPAMPASRPARRLPACCCTRSGSPGRGSR